MSEILQVWKQGGMEKQTEDVPIFSKGKGTDAGICPLQCQVSFEALNSSVSNEVDFIVKDYHRIFAETITYSFQKKIKTRSQMFNRY